MISGAGAGWQRCLSRKRDPPQLAGAEGPKEQLGQQLPAVWTGYLFGGMGLSENVGLIFPMK